MSLKIPEEISKFLQIIKSKPYFTSFYRNGISKKKKSSISNDEINCILNIKSNERRKNTIKVKRLSDD